jgi:hypothetical protein
VLAASFVMTGLLANLLGGASASLAAKEGVAVLATGPLLMSFFYATRTQRPFPPPTRDTVLLSDYRSQAITYRRQVLWLMAAAVFAVIGLVALNNPPRAAASAPAPHVGAQWQNAAAAAPQTAH